MKVRTNLDLVQNQLLNAVVENLASEPAPGVIGQVYYNTTDLTYNVFDGTQWVPLAPPSEFTGNISVTASGVDIYTGTGTPTIAAYDLAAIYITTFANANLTTTPTIDIDGIGVLNIVKSDETGIVPLEAGDIQPITQYYLTWDGLTSIQLFTQTPAADPGTYTNLNPVPVTLGGVVAGMQFNNTTYSQVFTTLFYPYLVPQFTSFAISGQPLVMEVGNSIAAGSKTYTWGTSNSGNIGLNNIRIRNMATVILSNSPNDGSQAIVLPAPITKTVITNNSWDIRATRTNGSYMTRTMTVWWYFRNFYGTSILPTLAEVDIEALSNSYLGITIAGTLNYAAGGYKYFVIPTTSANPALFRDFNTNLAVAMAGTAEGYTDTNAGVYQFQLINITNPYGITQAYKVYRTLNILGSPINITIS
jgi:hypothetical protein